MSELLGAAGGEVGPRSRRHALLRHEWAVISAGLRAVWRRPLDLLTVVIALPVLLLVAGAWTSGQSEQMVGLQAFAVGFVFAFYAATALVSRAAYHRSDGIMAADAQLARERLALAAPLFGAAAALGLAYLSVVGAYRPALWLAATVSGLVAGLAWTRIGRLIRERRPAFLQRTRPPYLWRARSRIRLAATAALLGTAGGILPLEPIALVIAALTIALIAGVLLGQVDAGAIRYRSMIGHLPVAVVRSHLSPLVAFFVPFAAALASAPHWSGSGVAVIIGAAVALLGAVRILAYQSFDRRIADWLVTILMAAVAIVGLALPPAAPAVMVAGLAWLARRAVSRIWLIE